MEKSNFKERSIYSLPNGTYRVEKHVYLRVRGNCRTYFFRYTDADGKQKDFALGSAKKNTLIEIKHKVAFLINAQAFLIKPNYQPVKKIKFEKFAFDTLSVLVKVKRWKNDSQRRFWQNCLSKYVFPKIGEKHVSEVTRIDLLDILEPIWETKTATASKLRGFLQVIFAYAIAEDIYKGGNPAVWQGNLEMKLPPVAKVKKEKHFKAMHYKELRANIHLLNGSSVSCTAIIFGILTASRSCEFSQAKWDEIDFKKKIWNCPASRRKDGNDEPFRVPLSDQCVQLLKTIERQGVYIFSVNGKFPIGRETPRQHLQKIFGKEVTMHGMRSSFRDWCAENQHDPIVAEKCLMHSTGNHVVRAYQRSDLIDQRRILLQQWADYLLPKMLDKGNK